MTAVAEFERHLSIPGHNGHTNAIAYLHEYVLDHPAVTSISIFDHGTDHMVVGINFADGSEDLVDEGFVRWIERETADVFHAVAELNPRGIGGVLHIDEFDETVISAHVIHDEYRDLTGMHQDALVAV